MPLALKQLVAAIRALTPADFCQVAATVAERQTQQVADLAVRAQSSKVHQCPHCQSRVLAKWGLDRKGLQRFRCKDCGATFNGFTGTPFAYLKLREKLPANARCMVEGYSLHRTADELGICVATAFAWRHRCLRVPEKANPACLTGIVEVDETYVLESFKGQRTGLPRPPKKRATPAKQRGLSAEQIPVLTAQSRSAPPVFSVVLPSRKAEDIDAALAAHLAPDVLLMTDGLASYQKMSTDHNFAYLAVPPLPLHKTQGILHLNNINAYHSRFKGWISRFRGVATKYLSNYLGWHRLLDAARQALTPADFLAACWG